MSKITNPSERLTDSERSQLDAWSKIAWHPFFTECFSKDDTLINAMIEKLDKVHEYLVAIDQIDEPTEDYE